MLCAVAILLVDSIPGSAIPRAPSGTDKIVHLTMYGTLGALTSRAALSGTVGGAVLLPLATVAGVGALDEWHQQFVPNRSMDARDWVADFAGGVLGVGLALLWRRRRSTTAGDDSPASSRTDQVR